MHLLVFTVLISEKAQSNEDELHQQKGMLNVKKYAES